MKTRSSLVWSLFMAMAAPALAAQPHVPTTYFVAPTGNDRGPGSRGLPWLTLQHAANSAKPGDTIFVCRGLYAGFIMGWDDPQPGEQGAPITFQAQVGAIITGRNNKTPDGIDLETGCHWIVLRGFTVNNVADNIRRAGIRVAGCDHVSILGNLCTDNGTWGIFTSHSNHCLIEQNIAARSATQHGIYVSNSAEDVVIRGNSCFDNAGCGIHLNGDASQGGDGLIRHALIENNIIHGNGGRRGGSAINCDGVQDSVIRCNLLYDNHANGISLFREDGSAGSSGNAVVNNTIVMAADSRWAINIRDASTHTLLCNNVLLNNNPHHGSIEINPDSVNGLASDYNLLTPRFSVQEDQTCDWGAYQSATHQDMHSHPATPQQVFVDAAGGDFHPLPMGPAVHVGSAAMAGAHLPTTDLDGVPLADPPDIGAFQSRGKRGGP